MPERFGGGDYRYGFQGQEADNEIKGKGNSVNYKYRMHDARLGRWLSLDPLAKKYPSMSPYDFVGNSPLIYIDPDGRKLKPTNINSKNIIKESYARIFSGELEEIGSNMGFNNEGIWTYNKKPALTPSEAKKIIKNSNLSRDEKLTAMAYLNAAKTERVYEIQVGYESGEVQNNIKADLNFGIITPNNENASLSSELKTLKTKLANARKEGIPTEDILEEMNILRRVATGSENGEASFKFYPNQDKKSVPLSSGLYNFQVNENGDNNQTIQTFDKLIIQIGARGAAYQEHTKDGKYRITITHFINNNGKFESSKPAKTKIKKR